MLGTKKTAGETAEEWLLDETFWLLRASSDLTTLSGSLSNDTIWGRKGRFWWEKSCFLFLVFFFTHSTIFKVESLLWETVKFVIRDSLIGSTTNLKYYMWPFWEGLGWFSCFECQENKVEKHLYQNWDSIHGFKWCKGFDNSSSSQLKIRCDFNCVCFWKLLFVVGYFMIFMHEKRCFLWTDI